MDVMRARWAAMWFLMCVLVVVVAGLLRRPLDATPRIGFRVPGYSPTNQVAYLELFDSDDRSAPAPPVVRFSDFVFEPRPEGRGYSQRGFE